MKFYEKLHYLIEAYGVTWQLAYKALAENDGDLMMAGGDIRDSGGS